MLPMVVSFAAPRGQNTGLSPDHRDPGEVAAYGVAVCIFSALFLVIPAASPWVFAVLAFLVPQFKRKFLPALLTVLALAMLVAAQEISGDTANYVRAFQALSQSNDILSSAYRWTASAEPVFWYVTYWVNAGLGESNRIILLFWAFFSIGAMAIGFRLVSRDAFPLAFALFTSAIYFHYGFGNAIRQGAAIGLLVLALGCFCQQRRRLALSFSLLAVGCHITAIAILPFFAIKLNYRREVFPLFIGLTLVSLIVMTSYGLWSDLAINLAPTAIENKVVKYFRDFDLMETLLSFNSIRMLFFVFLVFLVSRTETLKTQNFGYVAAFTIYVFIVQVAVSGSDVFYDRLALYRMPAEFLAYALILANTRKIRALQPMVLLGIPVYAIASGVVALGAEGYLHHSARTLLSIVAVLVE